MTNVDGTWETIIKTPMGKRRGTLVIAAAGESLSGNYSGDLGGSDISEGKIDGDVISCNVEATRPLKMTLGIEATVNGDTLEGTVKTSGFGTFKFSGTRA